MSKSKFAQTIYCYGRSQAVIWKKSGGKKTKPLYLSGPSSSEDAGALQKEASLTLMSYDKQEPFNINNTSKEPLVSPQLQLTCRWLQTVTIQILLGSNNTWQWCLFSIAVYRKKGLEIYVYYSPDSLLPPKCHDNNE